MDEGQSEKIKEEKEVIPTIRTMQIDAQMYIRQKNLSPLDIAAKTYAANPPRLGIKQPRSWRVFLVLGVVILMGAGVAVWWFFFRPPVVIPPPQPKPPAAIVRTEGEAELVLSPANVRQFLDSIEQEREANRPVGSLIYLPIAMGNGGAKRYINAQEFFQTLNINPLQSFLETILPRFYLFAFKGSARGSLAFAFRTNNFERSFSSLLSWERTMPRDLQYFISQNTAFDTLPRAFADKTIKNHDARVLIDQSGNVVLAYALFDKNFVILATSEEALAAVLERMIAVPPQ